MAGSAYTKNYAEGAKKSSVSRTESMKIGEMSDLVTAVALFSWERLGNDQWEAFLEFRVEQEQARLYRKDAA